MRLKYYKLTLRQMRFNKKPFVFIFILIISIIFIYFILMKRIEPTIKELCEYKARITALTISNKAVETNMQNITYDTLVTVNQDEKGKVRSITSNSIQMNKLAGKIEIDMQNRLQDSSYSNMTIPLGSIFGSNIFGGYGPKIKIKSVLSGTISVKFLSEFEEAGINQTKHKIILKIDTDVKTIAPFYSSIQTFSNDIVIAETVIIGEIPSTFYNISGMENVTNDTALELLE